MIVVDCEICMYYRGGKCTNPHEATYGVRMNVSNVVTCKGHTLYPSRDSIRPIKKIRKVKSIYDFEILKPRTIRIKGYANKA